MYKFCKSDGFFYNTKIHQSIPLDVVDVSDDEFKDFIKLRELGKKIIYDQSSDELKAVDVEPLIGVPQSISTAQGHLALIEYGKYQDAVDFIDAIVDPVEKLKAEVNFYRRNDWQRDNQTLIFLAKGLGISDAELDQMFIFGATQ